MASIRNCIKTLKKSGELSEDIAQQVQAAVAQHIKDGYSAKDAAREAVDDVLSDLRSELVDVYEQIGLTAEGKEPAASAPSEEGAAMHETLKGPANGAVMESLERGSFLPITEDLSADQSTAITRAIDRAIAMEQGKDVAPIKQQRVRHRLAKLRADLEAGKIDEAKFVTEVENLHAHMEIAYQAKRLTPHQPRARGADWIRQKLLEAKRRGDISEEAANFAEWFIIKNPALVDDLGISIRTKEEGTASGNYNPLSRVMTLFKGKASDTTAVHEILHHLERMMPADMQEAIRKEWIKQVTKELTKAQKTKDQKRIDYFTAVLSGDQTKATEILIGKALDGLNSAAQNSAYELPGQPSVHRTLDTATLHDLRREAAGLESPERGIFLAVTEDGRAVATGQPGTRVPETFTRFAEKHGLTFDARRIAPGQRGGSQGVGAPLGVASMDSAGREMSDKSPPMPIEYRASGAMYFGEMGSFIDRTGRTRFDLDIGRDYRYLNPSEFWAVSMTETAKARFDSKDSIWARSLQWLKEALEHIKAVMGLNSRHPMIKALDEISNGTGEFISKDMLGSSDLYASNEAGAMYFGEMGSFIDRTGKTRFSKAPEATITGETVGSIRAGLHQSIGKAVIDRLEQKGLLRIIKTADDLPHGRTISETGTALYDGNVAYLIADRMHPETAVREALHEIGEHHGLEGMLGKDGYAALVRRVRSMERFGNKRVRDAFATVRDLYPEYAENSAEFMHEVLANIGQDADIQAKPWWQEMLAAVKRWIVQLGYGGLIRDGDIQDMVLHSLKVAAGERQIDAEADIVKPAAGLESRQARQQALPNTGATPPAPPTRQTPMGLQGGATGNNASWNGYQASKLDDVIRTLQDKHIDSKRTVQAIKAAGRQVADKWDVYLQETLFHGRAAKRTLDFVETELTPLAQDLAMRGLTLDELDQYLHARHAEEANALIAQRNPAIPDGGSGMTNQQAHDYFANLDPSKRKRLEASAARVDAIIDRTRQLYVSYGLESQETIDGWSDTFKHYVPLMREDKDGAMGIGQGFSIKGKESKSRTGSTRAVVDIMANIAMQRERAIVRGEKNRVSVSLLGLAKLNPNPDFWMTDRIPMITGLNPATGLVETYPDPIYKSRENVVVAKVPDGKGGIQERAVVFNDENELAMNMARALKNLDAAQLEGLMGAASRVTRYFASINTQYNPVFGVTNLVRDVQDAMLNLTSTPIAGHKADVLKHTLSALRGIYIDTRQMRKGQPATSSYAQLWEEFQHEGGQTGYRDMFRTSADRARAIEKAIDPMKWMDSTLGQIFTAGGALRVPMAVAQQKATWLFDWLSDYNESMENAVRLAAYKVGLEQGMSKQQAAAMAKSLTVNFNRKGQIGMQAGALYAFFNASMQGTGRIAQTLFTIQGNDIKTIRLSKAGQKIVAGGILLGSMQALMLLAAGFDDDEPPEFVRERNTIIPIGNKKYITIPMPLGFAVLPNIGRIATEFVMGGFKSPAKHVTRLLGIMADAFNPVGGNGTVLQMVTPTALDPLAAIAENKDWTKKPIAKVAYDKTTPGHRLWKDTASTPGKLVAEAINTMSGGTKYVAGSLSPTPDQIDYLFGQVTGGVGRELSKAEQSAAATYRGEDLPPHKIPLVGRFYGDANAQSSQSTTFYNNINRINEYEAQINGLRKDGRGVEAAKFISEHPEARMVMRANHTERQVQKLRKEKHDLVEKDAPRERIKAIEDRIKAEMQRFNEAVKASKQREKEAA